VQARRVPEAAAVHLVVGHLAHQRGGDGDPVRVHLLRRPAAGRSFEPSGGASGEQEAVLPGMPGQRDDAREQLGRQLALALGAERRGHADVLQLPPRVVEAQEERAHRRTVHERAKAAHHAVGGPLALDLDQRPDAGLVGRVGGLRHHAVDAVAGEPLQLYRALRFGNPSPYMFCLRFDRNFTVLGSSPEVHLRVRGRTAELRPIAGTYRRGKDSAEDERLARELIVDPKERAEHVMLIDFGRNDLGRVAKFGTVKVTEQMVIERYSHVMHIVSHIVARLREDKNAFDAIRATFPAGTVSGAPKIRAMQVIAELEKARRGFYGGIVGYFGFDGSHDSCIAIRSIILKNKKAYLQAGAGIVADSDPAKEFEECVNKAKAMLTAIARATKQ